MITPNMVLGRNSSVFFLSYPAAESLSAHVEEVEDAESGSEFERGTTDNVASDAVGDPHASARKAGICDEDKSPGDSYAHSTTCSEEGLNGAFIRSLSSSTSLTTYSVSTAYQPNHEKIEMDSSSQSWNVIICVQLALILLLSAFSLYDLF